MNKTTKIYIGVGLVAAVGVGVYVVKKRADAANVTDVGALSAASTQAANAAALAAKQKADAANKAKIQADADARASALLAAQQADIQARQQLAAAQPAVQQLGVTDASKPHQIFVPGAGWVTVQAGGVSSAGHRSRYA